MSEEPKVSSVESAAEIRILRLNSDKTRKDHGSDTVYHVYFELLGQPPPEWRSIFGREWEKLNRARKASIDGPFLVLHCELPEVATTELPALNKAVAATNEVYKQYAQKEATAVKRREDVWNLEREDVEALGRSLRFE
jgi:hypothetical protein